MDWFLLPDVSDSLIEEVSKAAKGPFKGDPSFVYEHKTSSSGALDEGVVRFQQCFIRERVNLLHFGYQYKTTY